MIHALLVHLAYLAGAVVLVTVSLIAGAAAGSKWCRSVFIAWD